MMDGMSDAESHDEELPVLVQQAVRGDDQAWHRLMSDHWPRLRRMVALRMDPRLQGRIDPSPLLTDVMPVREAVKAFEHAADRSKAMKVQLSFE